MRCACQDSRFTKCCACHEICTSRSTKCCACHEIRTSRLTKCCTCHEICISRFTKCCATKCALRGPRSAAPATKSALRGSPSPRNLHFEVHKALHLSRNLHIEGHRVLCLPRNLQTSHMSKSHDSLHLSPPRRAAPATKTALRSKTAPIPCTCHEKSTLKHQNTRFPLRLPRKVTTMYQSAPGAALRFCCK